MKGLSSEKFVIIPTIGWIPMETKMMQLKRKMDGDAGMVGRYVPVSEHEGNWEAYTYP